MPFYVWVVALAFVAPVVVVAISAAVIGRVDAARERRRHARVLEVLGEPVAEGELVGVVARSVVTLEGRLVGTEGVPAGPLVSFHPYGTSFLDEPNVYAVNHAPDEGAFAVELDGGGRALLEGPMQVLAGSVESEHGAALEHAKHCDAAELSQAAVRTRAGQFRSVRSGDRVRVRGVAEPAPDDDALYRARSSVLRMSPESSARGGSHDAITVAAVAPPIRKRISPRSPVVTASVAAVVLGMGMAGATWQAVRAPSGYRADVPPSVPPSARTVPSCRAELLRKVEANRPLEAAADAKACDDPYARAMVRYANGELREASMDFREALKREPDLTPSLTEAEAHLLTHDFDAAATTVRRMIERFYPGPSTAEKRYLECIAGLIDDRARQATEGGLGPYIGKVPGKRYRKICSSRPFAKLARELDAEGGYWGDEEWLEFSSHTYVPDAGYDVVGTPFTAAVGTRARLTARPVGIEKSLLDRLILPSGPGRSDGERGPYGRLDLFFGSEEAFYPLMTAFAAELTLFYGYAGFPDRSAPYWPSLDRVAALLEAVPPRSFHVVKTDFAWEKTTVEAERTLLGYVMSIAAASALLSNDAARVKRYAALGEVHSARVVKQLDSMLRDGADAPWQEPAEDGHWADHKAVFDAAIFGDGTLVVKRLVAQRSTGRAVLPRVLPRIRQNRAALDRWFRESFPAPCLTCGASDYLGHLSDRREVARLLGDGAERDALLPAATRFTDALTDVSIAFELDELETFFGRKR